VDPVLEDHVIVQQGGCEDSPADAGYAGAGKESRGVAS
jgi:hypothetical protein